MSPSESIEVLMQSPWLTAPRVHRREEHRESPELPLMLEGQYFSGDFSVLRIFLKLLPFSFLSSSSE
jgi:hypothetical protein